MRQIPGYLLSILIGLAVYASIFRLPECGLLLRALSGASYGCTLAKVVGIPQTGAEFSKDRDARLASLKVSSVDTSRGLERVEGGARPFWVKSAGADMNGVQLLAYLMAEHRMISEDAPEHHVQRGDVVLDVGGHVGVFTDLALRRGASKVIAIEPEPDNFECLRRNFEAEIAQGRVVLVQAAAWSKPAELELAINESNSGMASLVLKEVTAKRMVKVPARRLDDVVRELGLSRVDFVKMDIEGAETEAIKGAAGILREHRPRMVLDAYHHIEDGVKLPSVIRSFNPAYTEQCGPCEYHPDEKLIVPHVTYYF